MVGGGLLTQLFIFFFFLALTFFLFLITLTYFPSKNHTSTFYQIKSSLATILKNIVIKVVRLQIFIFK